MSGMLSDTVRCCAIFALEQRSVNEHGNGNARGCRRIGPYSAGSNQVSVSVRI